jgi:uncharacterized repeat protein (TIGR04076 family)
MEEEAQVGFRVVGTVKAAKGSCSAGHKVGDRFELSGYSSGGLCGFFYHDIFPYLIMLQFGGGFPPEWGNPETVTLDCPDRTNTVTLELVRIRREE